MSLWHRAKFLYYIIFQSVFLPSPEELNKMVCYSFGSYLFKGVACIIMKVNLPFEPLG